MKNTIYYAAVLLAWLAGIQQPCAQPSRGAEIPWITYEAEDMRTTGTVRGPKSDASLYAGESSGQKYVELAAAGQFVEFTARKVANTMVVRYCLPDAPDGGGREATLSLYQNGRFIQKIPVTSKYSWLYGSVPFTNNPLAGKPRNFYDEVRLKDLAIAAGDVLRLEMDRTDGVRFCLIDLVDLESVAPPPAAPAHSLSVFDFGATGQGKTDDTRALKACIAAAHAQGKSVWVPPGTYKITSDINLPAGITIQGAGMWHTTFVGDAELYANVHRRIRFRGLGSDIHLADFALIGKLNYRNNQEENDGIYGTFGVNSTVTRVWVEHTKAGMWVVNSSNLVVAGCRFRDTLADGVNFCVGMCHSVIQNCTARGTGDDCFALWPTTYVPQTFAPGWNVIRHCTGQLPFLGNGATIYGGANNGIEDCRFTDIPYGCGILISTTFLTANPGKNIDNNFSGTSLVQNCDLLRSSTAGLQFCLNRRSIAGVVVRNLDITDLPTNGLSIIEPGGKNAELKLSNTRIENVRFPNFERGGPGRHGLWIRSDARGSVTVVGSKVPECQNDSPNFTINWE